MEKKVVKIEIPEGYEIDKEKSTFEKIVFKAIENELPKTRKDLGKISGCKIDLLGKIIEMNPVYVSEYNKSMWPTRELAEAALALSQLCQLRDRYNGDWKPDWTDLNTKYTICAKKNMLVKEGFLTYSTPLCFKTGELRDEFYNNFKDLIEIAKPLL